MNVKLLGYRITVTKIDQTRPPDVGNLPRLPWTRRRLARRVMERINANREYYDTLSPTYQWIEKIKTVRALTGCGLVDAKNWTETAFVFHTDEIR
jgi:hypothetical protein